MADKTLHPRRWTDLPERGTPAMLRLIHWTATAIGRWAARLLLYPTTLYFVISAHTARRMSYQYLRRLRGRPARWWHVFRHFHRFAATILDRVYLLTGAFQHFEIKFHHREILHQQVESGQGCILLGSHLGSFEVLRALGVTRAEFPLKVLMDVVHYEIYFERFAEEIILNRDRRAEDIQHWTQRYVDRLEHYARLAPYNWFNFYPFWDKSNIDNHANQRPTEQFEIRSLIPHSGSMCLLERVLEWDDRSIVCASNTHRDPINPLR